MRKIILSALAGIAIILTACDNSKQETAATIDPNATLTFWIAPSETQEAFWSEVIDKWNSSGQGMKIVYKTIPATGSSEEAILGALASDSAPDISENIFSGFGAQLLDMDVVQNLNEMPGYKDLIAKRHMENIMNGWSKNGVNPVFPIYSNPVLFWWRGDLLAKLGYKDVPRTYDDVYKLSEKYAGKNKYVVKVLAGKNWWDRWFDYISYYYAASNGQKYIDSNSAVFNNQHGKAVLEYIKKMNDNKWSIMNFETSNIFFDGIVLGEAKGPWDIAYARKQYPDLVKSIKIGPMLTPTATDKPYTLADSKGLVIFKTSKHPQDAWKFVQWVMANDDFSKLWIEKTGMPPARGDLLSNPMFKTTYDKDPLAAEYAKYVDVAVPPAMEEKTIDIQTAMGNDMIEPVIFNKKTPDQALKDVTTNINALLKP